MNTDDVLDFRRRLLQFTDFQSVPAATVYATNEWVAAVLDATAQLSPTEERLQYPDKADVNWAWDDGLLVVFEEPVTLTHLITSEGDAGKVKMLGEPEMITYPVTAMVFTPDRLTNAFITGDDGKPVRIQVPATGVAYLDVVSEFSDGKRAIRTWPYTTATLLFGQSVHRMGDNPMSQSALFTYALVSALGHRMTEVATMEPRDRPMAKRLERAKVGPIRILRLAGPQSEETNGHHAVDWRHSIKVRTHWRRQACGPKLRYRKKILIAEHVRLAHLPPDPRPTVWRAD